MPPSEGRNSYLRVDAERELERVVPDAAPPTERLWHELQVHQIELEMQNEALRQNRIELERSRDLYFDLYEFSPIGYLTLTRSGLIAAANLTVVTILGVERQKLLAKRFDICVVIEDRERWQHEFHNAFGHEDRCQVTLTILKGDGSTCVALLDFLCIANGCDEPTLRVALTDISERQRAIQSLGESHALNIAILNAVPAEIAVLDTAGEIIATNNAWQRYARKNAREPGNPAPYTDVGSNYLTACGGGALSHEGLGAHTGIKAVMSGLLPDFTLEYPCDAPRQLGWFSMSVTPLDLPGGGVVVARRDITHRKLAEMELARQEAQFRAVIELAAEGIWVSDDMGRLRVVNPAYVRRSGYSLEELMSMRIMDLEVWESPLDIQTRMEKIRHEGSDFFETQHRTKDGEIWPVEIHALYSASSGLHTVFLRDIGERKKNRAIKLALSSETENVLRVHVARQTIAALAHELNQPLNAIASYSDAALSLLRAGNPQPDRLLNALESATVQVRRAGQVVRELLAFVSHGDISTAAVDLHDLVRKALCRFEREPMGPIHGRLELEPVMAPVKANLMQVEKVLAILIQNSVEAVRSTGIEPIEITVAVARDAAGKMAQVSVRDNGPGIAPPILNHLFDPFFTTKVKGLGMGLSISRAIIEAHGGHIWAESEPGSGAAFHFTLPLTS